MDLFGRELAYSTSSFLFDSTWNADLESRELTLDSVQNKNTILLFI